MIDKPHFTYNSVVHLGALPPEPIKIKAVRNLIPIQVDYDDNGTEHTIQGYVDYANMKVILAEADRLPDIENAILQFLMGRSDKYDREMETVDIPPEVYEEAQFQMNRTKEPHE